MKFDLKVGYQCNNDCIHCVVAEKRNLVSKVTFEEIINSIPSNATELIVTGGEPTIRRDFFDILKAAKSKHPNMYIYLQTNGRKLSNKEFCKKTAEYVNYVLIALHSHVEEHHDAITQRKGSWQETMEGIHNCLSYIDKVAIQTVISKYNYKDLPEMYDFIFQELKIKAANFTFPHPNGNAFYYFDKVVPTYIDLKFYADQVLVKYKDKIYVEAIPFCYIHPLLDEIIINMHEPGTGGFDKALKEPIVDEYSRLILSEHRKLPLCKKCDYDRECIGVWKEYIMMQKVHDLLPINARFGSPISTILENRKFLLELLSNIPEDIKHNLIVFFSNVEDMEFCKQISRKHFIKCIYIHEKTNLLKAAFQFKHSIFIFNSFREFDSLHDPAKLPQKVAIHKSKKAIAQRGVSFDEVYRLISNYGKQSV